jgi:Zn-dependent protease with chaperone function
MIRRLTLGGVLTMALALLGGGCASVPSGAYAPEPGHPATTRVAEALHRAALAVGDDPARYGFAFVQSPRAVVLSDAEATFYVTDGLLRLPAPVMEAMLAHEVAHEALGHLGTRRTLSLSLAAGFATLGAFAPGAGLLDFAVSPLAVRAFTRRQVLDADRRAVEILRAMGYAEPRRALAEALRAVAAAAPRAREGGGLWGSEPPLAERLAALEPLEPAPGGPAAARRP